ncbi:MAG: ATP synthase F0 subunit C [Veillonellaceae bacterium]|nr:ATP synthase F0 subunit C [Veillonellaceae bacterium]
MEQMTMVAWVLIVSVIVSGVIASVAAYAAATNDAKAATTAFDAMARQPELAQRLFVNLLVSIGLIESIPIIAVVIAIVLVFANPLVDLLK